MSPCTSLTFKLHRRRESMQTCMAPGVLLESRQIAKSLADGRYVTKGLVSKHQIKGSAFVITNRSGHL